MMKTQHSLIAALERAEACASYIQILKELREKAQNQSQLSSAGDTSLVTRPSGAVSKASVSALLDGSQLISLNEATFTRAQTFLRDARRMHHRELIKQILLQHNLVTPQQLLAYDMKDPHLNSYVADLLRDALSTKVDARLVSRLFEYPTILSRFAPSAVLSHERFPGQCLSLFISPRIKLSDTGSLNIHSCLFCSDH